MSNDPTREAAPPPIIPLLLAGFGLLGAAFLWNAAVPTAGPAYRVLVAAFAVALIGVALQLQIPRLLSGEGMESLAAGMWGLGALACVMGMMTLPEAWDSLGLLYGMLAAAAVVAALITAVPPGWRRGLGSLLILGHFAAIFCAITVVPPPGGPPPYLSVQAYTRLFHSYLISLNLNNGYHFYAPDPGPCALTWFRVQWADGASGWVRIPDHPKMGSHLERRRYGALATAISQSDPFPPWGQELIDRRLEAGAQHSPPIPVADLPMPAQYREPMPTGKLLLASYARRVAREVGGPVESIKVYLVEYHNPPVEHFQAGRGPLDPTLYAAYYMGTFTPEGVLKDAVGVEKLPTGEPKRDKDGKAVVLQDPFLYWRLPIARLSDVQMKAPRPGDRPRTPTPWKDDEEKVVNFVRVHAGDKEQEAVP